MPKGSEKGRDEAACRPIAWVGTDKNGKKSYSNAVSVSAMNRDIITES